MTSFDIFVLILCILVFILLVAAFSFLIYKLFKASLSLIAYGAKDEQIIKEQEKAKNKNKKSDKAINILNIIVIVLLWIALIFIVGTTLYVSITQDNAVGDIPMLKTVKSGSMSKALEDNFYLAENNLTDQFLTTDLIVLEKLPKEEDLELYDIVLYERDGDLILHRIINIEYAQYTPNHVNNYLFQGDNVLYPDNKVVVYDQMKGIYRGKRIPFVGSFIKFMQSPAGYICLILVAIVTIILPIIDKKVEKAKQERLKALGYFNDSKINNDIKVEEENNFSAEN